MQKKVLNYENLIHITKALTHTRDHEEIALISLEAIKTGIGVKVALCCCLTRRAAN